MVAEHTSSGPPDNAASASGNADPLVCQWEGCGERFPDANVIYDHLCEKHIGRKSTNNLNLTCKWGQCRTSTVKRDHITSHMRVHVPLKPHRCDFCGKSFKRPQDLKKHVKTHADDSVLMRSPDPNRTGGGHNGGPAGNFANGNRGPGDLQSLAATANGYYGGPEMGQTGSYANANQGPGGSGYYGGTGPGSAYGQVYYAVNQAATSSAEQYEVRRRATLDALNEFFGDARAGKVNPRQYQDVGQRLVGLQGLELPVSGGYSGGGVSSFHGSGALAATHAVSGASPEYSLPLSNARTKGDLQSIDQFLEQLQATVYENESHAAAAGVAQPGSHYVATGLSYRNSHSPPGTTSASGHATSVTSGPHIETPALTPASSVASYTAGQSPGSVHSTHSDHGVTPAPRQAPTSMYPALPSVSAMSDVSTTYATSTGGAPASSLGSSFDHDGRRRWGGTYLGKAAPARSTEKAMRISPGNSRRGSVEGEKLRQNVDSMTLRSPSLDPNIDPTLETSSDTTAQEEDPDKTPEPSSPEDNAQANWIDNIRAIELLRGHIQYRLENDMYDDGDADKKSSKPASSSQTAAEASDANLYPILREAIDREG